MAEGFEGMFKPDSELTAKQIKAKENNISERQAMQAIVAEEGRTPDAEALLEETQEKARAAGIIVEPMDVGETVEHSETWAGREQNK
jgi:hypothetical protein